MTIEAWALVTENDVIISVGHVEANAKLALAMRQRIGDKHARLVHLVEDEDEKIEGR